MAYRGLQRAKSSSTSKKADAAKRKWVMEADPKSMDSKELSSAIYIAQTYRTRGHHGAQERLTELATEQRSRLEGAN